jgi:hypothetical protein
MRSSHTVGSHPLATHILGHSLHLASQLSRTGRLDQTKFNVHTYSLFFVLLHPVTLHCFLCTKCMYIHTTIVCIHMNRAKQHRHVPQLK